MIKRRSVLRVTSVMVLTAYLFTMVLSEFVFAQEPTCAYDAAKPSLESARKSFLALDYKCAEQELNDLIKLDTLSLEEKANAHVLMAEVYYAKMRNDGEKRTKVTEQFVAAFRAYRDWRGELNIKSPEFMSLMKDAQNLVDQQAAQPPPPGQPQVEEPKPVEQPQIEQAPVTETPKVEKPKAESKKKAWYTQWWAIGLGVGLVAGAIILAGGGGDEADKPLPGFPDTPAKSGSHR